MTHVVDGEGYRSVVFVIVTDMVVVSGGLLVRQDGPFAGRILDRTTESNAV